jgi:hypothetical protein
VACFPPFFGTTSLRFGFAIASVPRLSVRLWLGVAPRLSVSRRSGLPLRRFLGVCSAFGLRLCLGFDYFVAPIWLVVASAFGLAVGWVGRWAFGPHLLSVSLGLWLTWLGLLCLAFGVTSLHFFSFGLRRSLGFE